MARLICLDSNAIIAFVARRMVVEPFGIAHASIISRIEVLSNPAITTQEELAIETFFATIPVHAITPDIERQTILLRRQRRLKLPDAIIAATAIESQAVLITNDVSFENIDGLAVERFQLT